MTILPWMLQQVSLIESELGLHSSNVVGNNSECGIDWRKGLKRGRVEGTRDKRTRQHDAVNDGRPSMRLRFNSCTQLTGRPALMCSEEEQMREPANEINLGPIVFIAVLESRQDKSYRDVSSWRYSMPLRTRLNLLPTSQCQRLLQQSHRREKRVAQR